EWSAAPDDGSALYGERTDEMGGRSDHPATRGGKSRAVRGGGGPARQQAADATGRDPLLGPIGAGATRLLSGTASAREHPARRAAPGSARVGASGRGRNRHHRPVGVRTADAGSGPAGSEEMMDETSR